MIAVTFEVWPREGKRDEYLALAAEPRDEPIKGEGLISIERFESLHEEGKLPSLQFRRDEACVGAWRERLEHRRVQAEGRARLFRDDRPRVASVTRDYGITRRDGAPADSRAAHG